MASRLSDSMSIRYAKTIIFTMLELENRLNSKVKKQATSNQQSIKLRYEMDVKKIRNRQHREDC